jgi:hypothetical protein
MATATDTETYTVVDIENVVRRLKADLVMIADSTGLWSAATVANYVDDIELLAKKDYLAWVDVTLLSAGTEIRAVRYNVDTDAAALNASRPGGVLWPRVASGELRIILSYTSKYDADAREKMRGRLKSGWTASYDDTSHAALNGGSGRNYTSNAYGMKRKDWSQ